jgi:dTDP-4-dehydrorhamnose 3,5-epimerase
MQRLETRLEGPVLLEPTVHGDARGFFCETYREDVWAAHGVPGGFVQDNHSRSGRGVVRGMHFSVGEGQAKLVRCARGEILDVLVDIRPDSPTHGQWEGFALDDETMRQLYAPVGVLSEMADVVYKVSSYFDPDLETGFRFDDPAVGIAWPAGLELKVSARDREAPLLAEVAPDR